MVRAVVLGLAVSTGGIITGLDAVVRIFAGVALLAQVAAGVYVAEALLPSHPPGSRSRTRATAAYGAVALLGVLAGIVFQSGVVNLYSPGAYPAALDRVFHSRMGKGDYRWLAADVPVATVCWFTGSR